MCIGQQLGLWYSILVCCTLLPIPYIGLFNLIAAVVILIILIVKLYEMKRLAEQIGYAPEKGGGYGGGYGYDDGYKPIADPKNPYASPGDYGSPYPPS